MAEDWSSYNRVQITPRLEGAVLVSPRYQLAPEGSVVVSPRLAGPEAVPHTAALAAPEGTVIYSPRLEGTRSGPLLVSQLLDSATIGGLPLEVTTKTGDSSWPSLDCWGGWFRTFGVAFVAFCAGFSLCIILDRTVFGTGCLSSASASTSSIITAGMAQDITPTSITPSSKTPSQVGCYPAITEDGEDGLYDWTCADNPEKAYCRMGLPFFRLPMASGESLVDCVSFCLSKLMDLCGISVDSEGKNICRCGASENNYLVWGDSPAKANLQPPKHLNSQDQCSLIMFKTPEHDDFNEVLAMMEVSADDSSYIAGVIQGRRPENMIEGEEPVQATPPPQPVIDGQASDTGGLRFCYPNACADGGAWTTKQPDLTVKINYYFSNLGPAAQATFIKAKQEYERTTCLRFVQSSAKPTFKIDSSNPNSCSATVGYPGTWSDGHLNMGWCNSMAQLGNVIHEIGHIIGRTHTHKRPDATRTYMGEGPYLKINWQNIASDWRSQYTASRNAYIGSNEQSAGDPFQGHMRYDYLSIMSYGPGGTGSKAKITAMDSRYQLQMGQRDGLTELDILTVKDMYQCGVAGAVPLRPNLCFAILLAAFVKAVLS